ncbi:hypothetical protein [Embleya sp. MST-111070]|uniref:hypothetical protein n=1 Tax=Embleya sp. MST-111070 TaxID=3398231 RepID=UPI003F73A428
MRAHRLEQHPAGADSSTRSDRGFWQNLNSYGFDNTMSSYRTGSCAAHLAENNGGGGFWYPGNTNAYAYEPVVSAVRNDRVSSIFNV